MNHDNQDKDLRDAFRQLRDADTEAVRDFEASVESRGSWHVRRGTIGAGLLATALLAGLIVFLQPSPTPDSTATKPDPIEIPFDEYSKLIDQEMKVASLSEWRSPTAFLLSPES